jgi:excisionase family DNA binding protein
MSDKTTQPQAGTVTIPELLNTKAVANMLGVSTRQIQRWVAQGRLRAYKLGKNLIRFAPQAVQEFLSLTNSCGIFVPGATDQRPGSRKIINFRRAKTAPSTGVVGSPSVFRGKAGAK